MLRLKSNSKYYVYILRCADETLYTGITTNLKRRLVEHNQGSLGAKYTFSRRPVKIIYAEKVGNRSTASKREHEIKKLKRFEKEKLIKNNDIN